MQRRRIGPAVALFAIVISSAGALGKEVWKAPLDAAAVQNPLIASQEIRERGKKLYDATCADCHGTKGRGDGSQAADLDVAPTDFTQSSVQGQTDGSLFWKLTRGRKPMPGYANKMDDTERWSLVVFLRSINKPKN